MIGYAIVVMNTLQIVVGSFLITCGFLVKKYRMLIAGYNSMTKEQRAKVDIEGLSSMMKNHIVPWV